MLSGKNETEWLTMYFFLGISMNMEFWVVLGSDHTVSFKEWGAYTAEIIPFLRAFLENIDPTVMRLEEYWDAFMPILNQISGAM